MLLIRLVPKFVIKRLVKGVSIHKQSRVWKITWYCCIWTPIFAWILIITSIESPPHLRFCATYRTIIVNTKSSWNNFVILRYKDMWKEFGRKWKIAVSLNIIRNNRNKKDWGSLFANLHIFKITYHLHNASFGSRRKIYIFR